MRDHDIKREYLDRVLACIRWKQAHESVRRELSDHIDDQATAFEAEGTERDEALALAVRDMGDAEEVGLGLDASYRPRDVSGVALPIALLVLIGIACRVWVTFTPVDVKYLIAIALGTGFALAMCGVNMYKLAKYAPYVIMVTLPLIFLNILTLDNRHYSLVSPGFSASLAQYFLVCVFPALYAALIYSVRNRGMTGLAICGAAAAAACFSLCIIPAACSAATMVIALLVVLFIAIWSGAFGKNRFLYSITTLLAVFVPAFLIIASNHYMLARFMSIFNLGSDPLGVDFLGLLLRDTAAKAELLGECAQGIEIAGQVYPQAESFLYSNRSDYLLALMLYRCGRIPVMLLIFAVAAFLAKGFSRAMKLNSTLGRLAASGIMASYAAEALVYVLCNFGIVLGGSMPLPFITQGNTALVVNLAMAGLLLSLFRSDGLYADTPPRNGKMLRPRSPIPNSD